jgi:HEAT repeat protein
MWENHRRLIVLGGVAAVLAVGVLLVYGRSRQAGLIDQLHSGDPGEAVEAIHGLEKIGSDAAADAIADAAKAGDGRVAGQAVSALGRMGRAEDLRHIRAAAKAKDEEVRAAAMTALGSVGQESDVDSLVENLSDKQEGSRVRAAAALSLGQLDRFRAVPALIEALEDPSPLVRGRAYAAIRRIYQLDVGFRANDERAKRQAAIVRIRQLYPLLKERHADYVRRMKGREE